MNHVVVVTGKVFVALLMFFAVNAQAGVTISNTWVQTPSTANFDGSDYYTHTVTVSSDVGEIGSFNIGASVLPPNPGVMSQIHFDGDHPIFDRYTLFKDKSEQDYSAAGYDILQDTHFLFSHTEIVDMTGSFFNFADDPDVIWQSGYLYLTSFSSRALLQIVMPKTGTVWVSGRLRIGDVEYDIEKNQVENHLAGGLGVYPEPGSLSLLLASILALSKRRIPRSL